MTDIEFSHALIKTQSFLSFVDETQPTLLLTYPQNARGFTFTSKEDGLKICK
jgi:hypothetical protein